MMADLVPLALPLAVVKITMTQNVMGNLKLCDNEIEIPCFCYVPPYVFAYTASSPTIGKSLLDKNEWLSKISSRFLLLFEGRW